MKYWRRLSIVIVGFVESLLFSGCLFGWPSLLYVLQQEGIYSHLCPAPETTAPAFSTSIRTTAIFWKDSTSTSTTTSTPAPTLSIKLLEGRNGTVTKADPFLEEEEGSNAISGTETTFEMDPDADAEWWSFRRKRSLKEEKRKAGESGPDISEPFAKRISCKEQKNQLTLIYTIAAVAYGLTSILIGFSLDIFGLWFTRLGGCVMTSGGFFILAFTTKDMPWLLWPALVLIALGSSQLRLSSFQFANCWPTYRTTILILYSSAYSVSTALFLLIQLAYMAWIPYKSVVLFLAGLSLLTFPPTLIMPRMRIEDHVEFIPVPVEEGNKRRARDQGQEEKERKRSFHAEEEDDTPRILRSKGDDKKLMDPFEEPVEEALGPRDTEVKLTLSLFTVSAGLHLFWHFITFFLVLFYSATFLLWVEMTTSDPKTIAHYNSMNGICALIAPIFIPLAGLLTDWQIGQAAKEEDRVERMALTMQAPALTKAIASVFVLGTMICKVFFTPVAIYFSMILIAVSRPFIVGSCASYIRIRFHPSHFNRLNGIFTTLVAFLSFLQFPIIKWMNQSSQDFVLAQLVLIGLLVLAFSSPGHIMFKPLARKYARDQIKYRTDI